MQNLKAKANARLQTDVDVEIAKMDRIRTLQMMADDFKKIGSKDMEDRCRTQADSLKVELLARDLAQSPLTFGPGLGGNTPKTPQTPVTPVQLNLATP
jgi:hypothetical protein